MKKFVCSVCGYVHEGEAAPEICPICKAPKEKFIEQGSEKTWASEHVVGVAQGAPEDILSLIHIWTGGGLCGADCPQDCRSGTEGHGRGALH